MMHLRTLPPPQSPPAQPRMERLASLLVVVSAVTLETLPIFCWLLMLASYDTGDPNNAAMPFWWMWLLVFGAYWLGILFTRGAADDQRRRRLNTLLLTIAVAVLGPLSLLATYLLSPAAQTFLANGSDTSGPVTLALLVAWLWGRGLSLSRGRLTRGRISLRFILALGVTIAALAGAAAIQGATRDLAAGYLSLLLAALLFGGLMGLTLAQARDAAYEMRSAYRGAQPMATPPVFTRSWLAASLGLSLGISLLSLALTLAISRQSVRVLAIVAGSIANGLIDALQFVLTPLYVLIYLVLNKPIEWAYDLLHHFKAGRAFTLPTLPQSCAPTPAGTPIPTSVATPANGAPAKLPCVPPSHAPSASLLPAEWLTALRWGTAILIVVVILIVLARALHRLTELRRARAFSEERTMLDAREILGGQLRRFLDAFRRPAPADAAASNDLATGSVRRVYRDVLAAAATTGRARHSDETPQEYQRRITSDDPLQPDAAPPSAVAGALEELTRAYERARYGQRDAEDSPPATPDTQSAAEAVQRWLADQRNQERRE